jgi:phosphoenolpyruvate synthase/pyruvate phosphate dikinase
MTMVVPLRTHDSLIRLTGSPFGRDVVGGKGASLNRLAAMGAPVPESFALSTSAYRSAARSLGLPMRADDVTEGDLPSIRASILKSRLPLDLANDLARAYLELGAGEQDDIAVAVRSSATAEDSATHSFAGLHDTVLGVRGLPDLEAAVKRCWTSLWTMRAVAYRKQNGMGSDEADIAVVVQRMVRSDVSFIAFTADPVTGRTDRIVIDATWGLGEALVSGMVTPDHITLDAHGGISEYVVGEKASMVIPSIDGAGTREVPVPRVIRGMRALQPEQLSAIVAHAKSLAIQLGAPTDFEGGIAGGEIYFFQARPITTLSSRQLGEAA